MVTTKNNRLLLNSLLNSGDYLFDNFFRPLSNMSLDDSYKVEESESGWILKLSLPGVVKEEVELTTSDDRIYINIDSENGWEKNHRKYSESQNLLILILSLLKRRTEYYH